VLHGIELDERIPLGRGTYLASYDAVRERFGLPEDREPWLRGRVERPDRHPGRLRHASSRTALVRRFNWGPAALLWVLQDGEIRRLGGNHTERPDPRVVAATNWPLDAEPAAGRFRRALLYRLNVVGLTPPLREPGPDVARLADHCWKDIAATAGSPRDPGAGDGRRPGGGAVARQCPRAAERARQLHRFPPPLRPRRPVRPAVGVTRQGLSKLMARLQIDRFTSGRDASVQAASR